MTNAEKYQTTAERIGPFTDYCKSKNPTGCSCQGTFTCAVCAFVWLGREDSDPKLPCPVCGSPVQVLHDKHPIAEFATWLIQCYGCMYQIGAATKDKLIAEHNRLSRAVKGGAK